MRAFYADGDATHWPAGSCRAHAGGRRVSADGDATVASETNSLLLPCGSKQWRARCNQSSKSMHAFSLALIWSRSDLSDRPPPRSHPAQLGQCLLDACPFPVRARSGREGGIGQSGTTSSTTTSTEHGRQLGQNTADMIGTSLYCSITDTPRLCAA